MHQCVLPFMNATSFIEINLIKTRIISQLICVFPLYFVSNYLCMFDLDVILLDVVLLTDLSLK